MKIVATSDLHGQLPEEIPECDVLVLAGDLAPDYKFNLMAERQREWLHTTFREWLEGPASAAKHVVGIGGNHDFALDVFGPPEGLRWHFLEDSGVEIDGVYFYGSPWCPHLTAWAYYASKRVLQMRAETVPRNTDVLVVHSPPFGHLDNAYGRHVGDAYIDIALQRAKPKVMFCGHIHEQHGQSELLKVPIYNVSRVDDFYEVAYPLVTVEI